MWDFLIRRKSALALARKYGVTKLRAEAMIRVGLRRMKLTGYP
jgi:hypothetical protein